MIRMLFLMLFALIGLNLGAQVSFSEEPKVSTLMKRYEDLGKEKDYINGWRIKLVSTTDRRKLERTRYLFEQNYPSLKFSTTHESPYYSLKSGAFETRYDVEPMLVELKEDFPEAIPFRDKILKSELFESR